ncbi:MAG: hypothetical protein A3K19_23195 [Lentisphaerae bacterium RIFOXYB12_FULL_65_16]|nr:MAG: hypothetical protein A3K18_30805 [Lentisphaerae bacterium RIFOXYA12_64_32]OGV90277.1 MAG: hypothetical protein A3K19_23195 [Lentisphaerae bacterium RIFOXYB12_FULL_65_16]
MPAFAPVHRLTAGRLREESIPCAVAEVSCLEQGAIAQLQIADFAGITADGHEPRRDAHLAATGLAQHLFEHALVGVRFEDDGVQDIAAERFVFPHIDRAGAHMPAQAVDVMQRRIDDVFAARERRFAVGR